MSNKFDELTKSLAQSVTRRAALKKFGAGLAGMALAAFGLADKAGAAPVPPDGYCQAHRGFYTGLCVNSVTCVGAPSADCPVGPVGNVNKWYFCGGILAQTPIDLRKKCNFTT
jgi:hypothetical protein